MFTEAGTTGSVEQACLFYQKWKIENTRSQRLTKTIRIIGNYMINEILNDCFQKVFSYDEHCLVKIEETTLIWNTFI